jgi:hypothetical protein
MPFQNDMKKLTDWIKNLKWKKMPLGHPAVYQVVETDIVEKWLRSERRPTCFHALLGL